MEIKILNIRQTFNPECRYLDLKAFYSSYRFEFSAAGKLWLAAPMYMLGSVSGLSCRPGVRYLERTTFIPVVTDIASCRSVLDCFEPEANEFTADNIRTWLEDHRWPFYVKEKLTMQLAFDLENGWRLSQTFEFLPGESYTSREMTGFDGLT